MRRIVMTIILVATCAGSSGATEPPQPEYSAANAIPLPDGRWDLLSVDPAHHLVLIARGDSISIVDLATGTTRNAGTVSHGHAAVPIDGTGLIAVTSGGDNSVRLINGTTGAQTASIAVGQNPDAAIYDLDANLITLLGNVDLRQGSNRLNGGRLVIDLNSGRSTINGGGAPGVKNSGGRVTGTFTVPQRPN